MSYELADIAEKFFGTPYVFGGNDIETGIDCSGFVCEVLRSVGLLDMRDYTAQMLHDKFEDRPFTMLIDRELASPFRYFKRGDIIFYGNNVGSITHVSIYLGDGMIIEAGGEGRKATTRGYVRYRKLSINSRADIVAVARLE